MNEIKIDALLPAEIAERAEAIGVRKAGFEHSIANMYFVPYALLIQNFDPAFIALVADKVPQLNSLTWPAFLLNNLCR